MIRKALSLVVTLAVQTAAVMTPFMHAHLDEHATEHHGGAQAVHSHLSAHAAHHTHHLPSTGPVIDDDDRDIPVYLPLFVAVSGQTFDLGAVDLTLIELPDAAESPAHRSILVVHGHDPPFYRSLSSRAPPAFLS